MPGRDRLGSLILAFWSRYHPKMLAELQQHNRLPQTLAETTARFAALLFDLIAVHKMEHYRARKLAIDEILPPKESSTSSQRKNSPATSE